MTDKDENGVPTEPFVGPLSGGGGSGGWRWSAWVFPLPSDGLLEIFISIPALGLGEASLTVDGSAVRLAAQQARVIWS